MYGPVTKLEALPKATVLVLAKSIKKLLTDRPQKALTSRNAHMIATAIIEGITSGKKQREPDDAFDDDWTQGMKGMAWVLRSYVQMCSDRP